MFLGNIDQILKAMPHVQHGYYLPFHEDHLSNFKGLHEYGSKLLSTEDRKRGIAFQSKAGPSVTAFVNGDPVAVFGCVLLWRGVGEAWSLFTSESRRYPIAMTKGAISFFNSCQTLFNLHRLQITVNSNDKRAMSWAKALGFISEGLMVDFSADKDDTHMMRRK
jgi:hypothetical protein